MNQSINFNRFPFLFFLFVISTFLLLTSTASGVGNGSGLVYSTFVGTEFWDGAEAVAVDSLGRAYIVARTESVFGFPGFDDSAVNHEVDLAVFRVNAAGTGLDYVLYFNTTPETENEDHGYDIIVDNNGSAYVVGQADKANLCSFLGNVPGYDPTYNGGVDAFVMKVLPDGNGLDYCTFLGGTDWDTGYSIALDSANNAYVAGFTWSTDFPVTDNAYDRSQNGARDVFVARLSADGTQLNYATYFGGDQQESATALTVDNQGSAYVTGWTNSANLPNTGTVYDPSFNGSFDAFAFKLNSTGSSLLFNTYLGGEDEDRGRDIVLDNLGNVHVVGETRSPDFPVTAGALDPSFGGGLCDFINCADVFVLKLGPTAGSLGYSTFIGGAFEDLGTDAFMNGDGRLFVTGETRSPEFPTTELGYDTSPNGNSDVFVLLLNTAGSALDYGTFLGAGNNETAFGIWADTQYNIYLTGQTRSTSFPITPNAFDTIHNGDYDIFVSKIMMPIQSVAEIYLPAVLHQN
jgi:hypothetical protein